MPLAVVGPSATSTCKLAPASWLSSDSTAALLPTLRCLTLQHAGGPGHAGKAAGPGAAPAV